MFWLRVYETFFMFNSTEHKVYHAHKCLDANNGWHLPTIVGILTFISMINTTSENLKARKNLYFSNLDFMSN